MLCLYFLPELFTSYLLTIKAVNHTSVNIKSAKYIGLGQYGLQLIRYVFDTDLADTIRIRYDSHVHVFKIKKNNNFDNKVNVLV